MKIEKTFKQVIEFDIISGNYLSKVKKGEETAFSKCLESVNKQVRKIFPEYQEKRDFIRMAGCVKDEKTSRLILDDKDYTFTAEGLTAVKAKLKELDQETVTIHQRILPENNDVELTAIEKECFEGFVIDLFEDEFEKQFRE